MTLLVAIESALLLVPAAIVAVTTATTPLLMVLEFMPVARQFTNPAPETQVSVSLTAVSAGPATILKEVMSLDGYASVHCRPAGAAPETLKERFKEMDPPLTADPEARFRDDT
jgi:hypothetical protein